MNIRKEYFINQVITGVKLFLANEQIIENKDSDRQFVDGGIELTFESGKQFSMGFSSDLEMILASTTQFHKLYTGDNSSELSIENDCFWNQVIGQRIVDAKIEFNLYEDEEGTIYELPLIVTIQLENNLLFAMSAMDFEVRNRSISDIYFSHDGWVVIHFDKETIAKLLIYLNEEDSDDE